MSKKISYRIKNWPEYNRALINRGNINIWISDEIQKNWIASLDGPRRRGRSQYYSDTCIELFLTIRNLFQLPLRATQGFFEGFFQMLGSELDVPSYSQCSRRAKMLNIDIRRKELENEPLNLVIDSTGLKIYGEGEWKMRTHGKQKRRTWRKVHVSVNPKNHQVIELILTEANVHDSLIMPGLLKNMKNIGNVYADGAYTTKRDFDAIAVCGGRAKVPVRTGTTLVKKNPSPGEQLRNELIREIRKTGGKTTWKKTSGYHLRSLVETHMFRLKTILGPKLHSRNIENQKTEARVRAKILNQMSVLGMPISVAVA
jgi:IS5 family transposase